MPRVAPFPRQPRATAVLLFLIVLLPARSDDGAPADAMLTALAGFRFAEARALAAAETTSDVTSRLAQALAALASPRTPRRDLEAAEAGFRSIEQDPAATTEQRAAAAYFAVRLRDWHHPRSRDLPSAEPLDAVAAGHPDTFFGQLALLKAAALRLAREPDAPELGYWFDEYARQVDRFAISTPALQRNLHQLLAEAAARRGDDALSTHHLTRAYALGVGHRGTAKLLLTRLVRLHARMQDFVGAARWLEEFDRAFPSDVLGPQLHALLPPP
jgi:hypothetical protein